MACHLSLSAVHVAGLAVTKGTARLAFAMTSTGARPFKVIVFLIFILLADFHIISPLGILEQSVKYRSVPLTDQVVCRHFF